MLNSSTTTMILWIKFKSFKPLLPLLSQRQCRQTHKLKIPSWHNNSSTSFLKSSAFFDLTVLDNNSLIYRFSSKYSLGYVFLPLKSFSIFPGLRYLILECYGLTLLHFSVCLSHTPDKVIAHIMKLIHNTCAHLCSAETKTQARPYSICFLSCWEDLSQSSEF